LPKGLQVQSSAIANHSQEYRLWPLRPPRPQTLPHHRSMLARINAIRPKRLIVAAVMILLAALPTETGELTGSLMTDTFTQVSVFVAATLLLFYGAERLFHFDMACR
jgi:hypothetical protein